MASARALLPVLLSFAVLACDDEPKRPDKDDLLARPSASAEVSPLARIDAGALDGGAARKVLSELRSDKLELNARRVPAERVAFVHGRLAVLTSDALVVRDTKSWKEIAKVPALEPRRVIGLADGSVLAASKDDVTTLAPRKNEVTRTSRIPLFPESVLFPDLRKERRMWVLHGFDPTLYGYEIEDDGKLNTLDFIELKDFDLKAFTALKDGSFLYTTKKGLRRFFPGGRAENVSLPEGPGVWRLLTTRRIDQVWVAREGGTFELLGIAGGKGQVVRSLTLPSAYDVATSNTAIAILRLERSDKKRHFALRVVDADGKQLMEQELPLSKAPGDGEDWVEQITKNRAVAIAPKEPLVAVGGPTWLSVWNYKTQKRVYGSD